jgi:NADPH:quinone reductase-like Zn-dependent oxidoreductase
MKAVRYHAYGDSDVLNYEDADLPVASAGHVLVRVAGSAFNPVDVAIRAGFLGEVFPLTFPHTPNFDVAGVITAIGDGVTGWKVGDPVVAYLPMTGPGAAAEYVVVAAELLSSAPRTVDLADAAALPSSGLTAWQALFDQGKLTAGQSVLINGAGGAVGGYAVQLAKQAGATVTAAASARSVDRVRAYGADHLFSAQTGFDVVLNLAPTSPDETARLVDRVAVGGILVSATTPPPAGAGVRVFSRSDATQLAELVARVDAGTLRIHVAQRRPLADLRAVHDESASGRLLSKTILIP